MLVFPIVKFRLDYSEFDYRLVDGFGIEATETEAAGIEYRKVKFDKRSGTVGQERTGAGQW